MKAGYGGTIEVSVCSSLVPSAKGGERCHSCHRPVTQDFPCFDFGSSENLIRSRHSHSFRSGTFQASIVDVSGHSVSDLSELNARAILSGRVVTRKVKEGTHIRRMRWTVLLRG